MLRPEKLIKTIVDTLIIIIIVYITAIKVTLNYNIRSLNTRFIYVIATLRSINITNNLTYIGLYIGKAAINFRGIAFTRIITERYVARYMPRLCGIN
jgi:hypothetical protein